MEIIGFVEDGVLQASSFTQLDWVREQFRVKIGFEPYPGTLNVRVPNAIALKVWRARPGIMIVPSVPGYCAARCYPARVGGQIAAAWIIPEVPGYPDDLVELMAPVSLRAALQLKTGDVVSIRLSSWPTSPTCSRC